MNEGSLLGKINCQLHDSVEPPVGAGRGRGQSSPAMGEAREFQLRAGSIDPSSSGILWPTRIPTRKEEGAAAEEAWRARNSAWLASTTT